jgi:transcriptional regulator with PAS, ATPase and Fis domain
LGAPVGGELAAVIGSHPSLLRVLDVADTVAPSDATVLITGESGSGKEVLAQRIHQKSGRKGAFVAVNCAALPRELFESELFGHERGAFTGALCKKLGKFELAQRGTILLDEISGSCRRARSRGLGVRTPVPSMSA